MDALLFLLLFLGFGAPEDCDTDDTEQCESSSSEESARPMVNAEEINKHKISNGF